MGNKRKEMRLSKIEFVPKIFSASEQAAWDKMWDMILGKVSDQLQGDDLFDKDRIDENAGE